MDVLVEDAPVNLLLKKEEPARPAPPVATPQSNTHSANVSAAKQQKRAQPPVATAQATVPDDKAVSEARFAAESARSLSELRGILESFDGCNLKHSARSTICLEKLPETRIMAVCGFPTGDDDRSGEALSGKAGALFERMLAAIGLDRSDVGVTTAVPWRAPGDRSPTPSETDICLPFLERQIALAEPATVLILGNFACRMLIDRQKTVFDLRGKWQTLSANGTSINALVSFAPSELLAAPANKKLAWQDLQAFNKALV